MISEGQEATEEAVAGGRGSELGVFLTDSGGRQMWRAGGAGAGLDKIYSAVKISFVQTAVESDPNQIPS